jgi:hypothetical protein
MTQRLQFHDEALSEIRSAARWYDRQRRGLGAEFLNALQLGMTQLLDAPTPVARSQAPHRTCPSGEFSSRGSRTSLSSSKSTVKFA